MYSPYANRLRRVAVLGRVIGVPAVLTLEGDEWSADTAEEAVAAGFIEVDGADVQIDDEAVGGEPLFVQGSRVYTEATA